jgi:hypothetical protein
MECFRPLHDYMFRFRIIFRVWTFTGKLLALVAWSWYVIIAGNDEILVLGVNVHVV